MVYKIRNKGFFVTQSGWKNHYHMKVLNDVKDTNPAVTLIIRAPEDVHPHLRYFCQYRAISRKIKQYLYGDRQLEAVATQFLKSKFQWVWNIETPIMLVQPDPDKRLVNQGDREHELISHNYHPYQLEFYRANNRRLQQEREEEALRQAGEKPLVDQAVEILRDSLREAKERKGDELTSEEMHRIMEDIYTRYKVAQGSEHYKNPNGTYNDFLEVRRPYIEPGQANVEVNTK